MTKTIEKNKVYYNWKLDISNRNNIRCFIITDNDGLIELFNPWLTKWEAIGFDVWKDPNWEKSGIASWTTFAFRYPKAGPPRYQRLGSDDRITCFYKAYNSNAGEFKYYKKEIPISPQTKTVQIEYKENDRVEQSKETGLWVYLDPVRESHWQEQVKKYYKK